VEREWAGTSPEFPGAIQPSITPMCKLRKVTWRLLVTGAIATAPEVLSQNGGGGSPSCYITVDIHESFASIINRMTAAKPDIEQHHNAMLEQRYDLTNRPAPGVTMSIGKLIQAGVRVKLAGGMNWHGLAALSPDEIKNRDVFPQAFMPLPHVNHAVGGMVFPKFSIDEIKRQEDRDLTCSEADFDLPEQRETAHWP
jgi:cytochrome c peroxidase